MNEEELAFARSFIQYFEKTCISNETSNFSSGSSKLSLLNHFIEWRKSKDSIQCFGVRKFENLWNLVSSVFGEFDMSSLHEITIDKIISNGANFIESNFLSNTVKSTVLSRVNDGMMGGVPGTLPLVKSYVNIMFKAVLNLHKSGNSSIEILMPWPIIYYCLRCGSVQAALTLIKHCNEELYKSEIAISNSEDSEVLSSIGRFLHELKGENSKGYTLKESSLNEIRLLYKRVFSSKTQPFSVKSSSQLRANSRHLESFMGLTNNENSDMNEMLDGSSQLSSINVLFKRAVFIVISRGLVDPQCFSQQTYTEKESVKNRTISARKSHQQNASNNQNSFITSLLFEIFKVSNDARVSGYESHSTCNNQFIIEDHLWFSLLCFNNHQQNDGLSQKTESLVSEKLKNLQIDCLSMIPTPSDGVHSLRGGVPHEGGQGSNTQVDFNVIFMSLFLTCQYESAVDLLMANNSTTSSCQVHAIHIALALKQLLFDVSSSRNHSFVSSPKMTQVIDHYIRQFVNTSSNSADLKICLQYFYFTFRSINSDNSYDDRGCGRFVDCLVDLIGTNQERFEYILGSVNTNRQRSVAGLGNNHVGSRQNGGLINALYPKLDGEEIGTLILSVAKQLEIKGKMEEAVRAYHLASHPKHTMSIINKLIVSEVLSGDDSSGSSKVTDLAIEIATEYKTHGLSQQIEDNLSMAFDQSGLSKLQGTFFLLLDLITFYEHVNVETLQDPIQALLILKRIKILPFALGEVEEKVAFFRNNLTDELKRCIPNLLLSTVSLLQNVSKTPTTRSLESLCEGGVSIGEQVKAIIAYAASIPYKLPGDTNARLVQAELASQ